MKEVIVSSIRPVPRSNMELDILGYLDYIGSYLDVAAGRTSDIVCLPEVFPEQEKGDAEKVPGPITDFVAKKAKATSMYVIAPIIEQVGEKKYNSALLIDRKGQIAGKYHKIHTIPMERDGFGISAGDSIPVFETDFGLIGIMTCFDGFFPELAAIMARKGAKIIFYPHRENTPGLSAHQLHVRARAMDNSVYVVTSTCGAKHGTATNSYYTTYPSYIVCPNGEIILASDIEEGILTTRFDADGQWFVSGHGESGTHEMKGIIAKFRRPDVYRKEDATALL